MAERRRKKRKVEEAYRSDDYVSFDGYIQPSRDSTGQNSTPYHHVIVHHVVCSHATRYHIQHASSAHYFDVPRLLKGSSRNTGLVGRQHLPNLERFLEDNDNISFAICFTYSCEQYHKKIESMFERQPIPPMDEDLELEVKPYFFRLRADAKPATPDSEAMFLSNGLQEALQLLDLTENGILGRWDASSSLEYPYPQLYHYRKVFIGKLAYKLELVHQLHLMALSRYFNEHLTLEYIEAEKLFEAGRVQRKHWDKMFRPKEVLVTKKDGHPMAYMLWSCPRSNQDMLQLDCWSWDFDGSFFKMSTTLTVSWPSKSDVIPISQLQVFPLRLDKTGSEEVLRRRGKIFWSCRKQRFVDYDVPPQGMEFQKSNMRYMIDMEAYKVMHVSEDDPGMRDELDDNAMQSRHPPAEPFELLLPGSIRGYGFHNKKWVMLMVEHIRKINWNKDVFKNRLVLEPSKKNLIQALVSVHIKKTKPIRSDFMDGKGEGLIILLHGGPGTGKTLTAESVAEFAKRPLYRVTCGDIGTDPVRVEEYLESVLFIGSKWGCVVLLDEADVFLEERTKTDLQRNALVSVFLRVLEYYDGILILTTNRIGTFDEAFKSRVQLALHFPTLDELGRRGVWRNFAKSLSEKGHIDPEEIDQNLDQLAKHNLNGRQIRNIISTARQVATYRKQALQFEHIDESLRVVNDFEEYVTKVHKHTDEAYARYMRWRDD